MLTYPIGIDIALKFIGRIFAKGILYLGKKCIHRKNGPALKIQKDTVVGYLFGFRVALNVASPHGLESCEHWFRYGKRHREDGPAIEYTEETFLSNEWWLHDKNLAFDEWINELSKIDEEHATLMKLKYG